MHRLTSSLRSVPLADTAARAEAVAAGLGITRVTDTTWLDSVGIPVFASVRPSAAPGSLCVNAGKGVRPEEARVGALMEAIEFARAEYGARTVEVFDSTPHEVASQPGAEFDFVDLCPLLGRQVDPHGRLVCVMAEDIVDGTRIALPAELVFSPYKENPGQRIFGTSTNGLSSGNTVEEATLHGLAEVIERDVNAFNHIADRSRLVKLDNPPPEIAELVAKVEAAGLRAVLRYTPNEFGLPYVAGFILEPGDDVPIAIAHGAGLHPVRDIAAVRGLCEAAQSRLTGIHGGRDDLLAGGRYTPRAGDVAALRARVTDATDAVRYSEIPTHPVTSIDSALQLLLDRLQRKVYRVILSTMDSLAAVRVIVPGLESLTHGLNRVGPRLAARA
ncbi:YcaO-like family protein [Allokutzneria sp. NRRL B-24872]|uniref:YcaO-like family protein n=1 Tax=Allokutzneria sp. NRRL B-24872 TaxID=1137961 RepID=UPI000A37B126|nr:YcaO-like family protein [Allokutzneria sp. NRRL B-24872]